jgi:type IV secretion system protein VirB1
VGLCAYLVAAHADASAGTLASYVLRCAPHVAPRTALAIISVESGGRWWAVNDNDRPATPSFETPAQAIAYATQRVAEGGNIDLGLTQLNSSHLSELGLTVSEAFEPCTNIAMGMGVLQRAWHDAEREYGVTRYALLRAFEGYNGGTGAWTTRNPALRAKVERYADEVWQRAASMPFVTPAAPSTSSRAAATPASHAAPRQAGLARAATAGVQVIYQEGSR